MEINEWKSEIKIERERWERVELINTIDEYANILDSSAQTNWFLLWWKAKEVSRQELFLMKMIRGCQLRSTEQHPDKNNEKVDSIILFSGRWIFMLAVNLWYGSFHNKFALDVGHVSFICCELCFYCIKHHYGQKLTALNRRCWQFIEGATVSFRGVFVIWHALFITTWRTTFLWSYSWWYSQRHSNVKVPCSRELKKVLSFTCTYLLETLRIITSERFNKVLDNDNVNDEEQRPSVELGSSRRTELVNILICSIFTIQTNNSKSQDINLR